VTLHPEKPQENKNYFDIDKKVIEI